MISTKIKKGILLDEDAFDIHISTTERGIKSGSFAQAFTFTHQFGIGDIIGNLDASISRNNVEIIFARFNKKDIKKTQKLYKDIINTDKEDVKEFLTFIADNLKEKKEFIVMMT